MIFATVIYEAFHHVGFAFVCVLHRQMNRLTSPVKLPVNTPVIKHTCGPIDCWYSACLSTVKLLLLLKGFLMFKDFCENVSEEPVPQLAFYEEVIYSSTIHFRTCASLVPKNS